MTSWRHLQTPSSLWRAISTMPPSTPASGSISTFYQGATLDLCYTNIKKCYKCKTLPPLGKSDHEMVLLMPNYKTKLIDSPPVEKEVFVYNKEACTKMTDCFELTDWNVFTDSCADNLDELNDHVSCYYNFVKNQSHHSNSLQNQRYPLV